MLVITLDAAFDESALEAFVPAVRLLEAGKYTIGIKGADGLWASANGEYKTRDEAIAQLEAASAEVYCESDVANTILQQLGGNKFVAMTGAKNFLASPDGISFRIGSNASGVNAIRIKLNGSDEYDIEFLAIRGTSLKVKGKEDGVQADQLARVFTKHTGMVTSLGNMQKPKGDPVKESIATLARSHKKGDTEYRTTLRIDEDGTVHRGAEHRTLNESFVQDAAFAVWRKLEDARPETVQSFVEWAESQGYAKVDNLSKPDAPAGGAPAVFTESDAARLYAIIAEHVRLIPWALVESFDAAKDDAAKIAAAKAIAEAAGQVIEGLGATIKAEPVVEANLDESKVIVAWSEGRPTMITANLEPEEVRFWVTELKRSKREYDVLTPQEAKQIRKDMATGAAENYVNKKPAKAEDATVESTLDESKAVVSWLNGKPQSITADMEPEQLRAWVNILKKTGAEYTVLSPLEAKKIRKDMVSGADAEYVDKKPAKAEATEEDNMDEGSNDPHFTITGIKGKDSALTAIAKSAIGTASEKFKPEPESSVGTVVRYAARLARQDKKTRYVCFYSETYTVSKSNADANDCISSLEVSANGQVKVLHAGTKKTKDESIIVEGDVPSSVLVAWVSEEDWSEEIAEKVAALAKDNGGIHDGTDTEEGEVVSVYSFDTEDEADAFAAAIADDDSLGDPDIVSLDNYEDDMADEMETDESFDPDNLEMVEQMIKRRNTSLRKLSAKGSKRRSRGVYKMRPAQRMRLARAARKFARSSKGKVLHRALGAFVKRTESVRATMNLTEDAGDVTAFLNISDFFKGITPKNQDAAIDLLSDVVHGVSKKIKELVGSALQKSVGHNPKSLPAGLTVTVRESIDETIAALDEAKAVPTKVPAVLERLASFKKVDSAIGSVPWITGTTKDGGIKITAQVFPEPAHHGINGSRVSKLYIKKDPNGPVLLSYDRAWDVKPTDAKAKQILAAFLKAYPETVDEADKDPDNAYNESVEDSIDEAAANKATLTKTAKGWTLNVKTKAGGVQAIVVGKATLDYADAEKVAKTTLATMAKDGEIASGVTISESDDAEESVTVPRADIEKLLIECGKLQLPETTPLSIEKGMVTVIVAKEHAEKLRTAMAL